MFTSGRFLVKESRSLLSRIIPHFKVFYMEDKQLVMCLNSFSGRIPESIKGLMELVILDLNHNNVLSELGEIVNIAKINFT